MEKRKEIVYDKETFERLAALQRCTFVPYADGSLVGVHGPNLEVIGTAAQALVETPTDIAALIGEVERLRQALEERTIDYELLSLYAHNFQALATYPAWAGEDCRLCQSTRAGHAADCPYALADKALHGALTKEEPLP